MSEPKADLPLLSVKTALGPPVHLDYRALDLAEAHRRLGEHVRAQVHHILLGKIQTSAPEALAAQVRLARYCQATISRKLANSGEEILRSALEEYVTCLAAWEQGAELAAFGADHLRGTLVDGQPVLGADLAYLLQDDETGCQTGLWRAADGSAVIWHTEEDRTPLGERFDRLRYMHFTVAGPGSPAQ